MMAHERHTLYVRGPASHEIRLLCQKQTSLRRFTPGRVGCGMVLLVNIEPCDLLVGPASRTSNARLLVRRASFRSLRAPSRWELLLQPLTAKLCRVEGLGLGLGFRSFAKSGGEGGVGGGSQGKSQVLRCPYYISKSTCIVTSLGPGATRACSRRRAVLRQPNPPPPGTARAF